MVLHLHPARPGSTPLQVRAVDDSANIGAVTAAPSRSPALAASSGTGHPCGPHLADAAGRQLHQRRRPPSSWACASRRPPTASSPASGSTRAPATPAPTSAPCGAPAGRSSPAPRSPTSRASGWQSVSFTTPVAVSSGTTYVVSYTRSGGHYTSQPYAFLTAGSTRRRSRSTVATAPRPPASTGTWERSRT